MYDNTIHSVVTIFTAIIGLAIIAVIVSKNANTENVIGAGFSGLARGIEVADGPVSGNSGFGGTSSGYGNEYPAFG